MVIASELATAFAAPFHAQARAHANVRFTTTPLMSEELKIATEGSAVGADAMGVVVPTGGAATPVTPPKPIRPATWNPQNLPVPPVPAKAELFAQQFVPEYLKQSPSYLDGSLPGDIGFDPWGLAVLANPQVSTMTAAQALDAKSRTAEQRNEQMLALSEEEQAEAVLWMRNSELKHGRLAMLAVAGWPIAEMLNGNFLRSEGMTNGRAPSLFNGHLTDHLPFLLVVFGGLAALELKTKDTVTDGDYAFDPLGFASGIGSMRTLQTAEIKHGRAAMMGITGFAVQEFLYGTPVVQQTPFFFLPFGGFTG